MQPPRFRLTLQPNGYATSLTEEVEVEASEDGLLDLLHVRGVGSKEEAPCFLPCVLRGGADSKTRKGRRRVTDADGGTALVYDLDVGDVDQVDLEKALSRLGVLSAYWPTWSSGGKTGQRWRVLIPLATMVERAAQEDLWKAWGRAIETGLVAQAGERRDGGWLDWQARSITQPAVLPCRPSTGNGSKAYPWGGHTPSPVAIEGTVLSPGTRPPGRRQAPKEYGSRATPLTPYMPDPNKGDEAVAEFSLGREGKVLPIAALDGVALLCKEGVRTREGGRHATLSAAIWTLYRLGAEPDEWLRAAEQIIESTPDRDQRHLLKLAPRLVTYHDRKASGCEEAARTLRAACGDVPKPQRPALARYCRVLARAAHLRGDGGRLDHEAIARIVGIDVRVITAWRGKMVQAGLVIEHGEKRARRYRVAIGATIEEEDWAHAAK